MSVRSNVLGALKPEYVFQPRVLLRRLLRSGAARQGLETFKIPGGAMLIANSSEEHGRMLKTLGVVDLPVTETLWRLADKAEVALDLGANIGYMTGVLGARLDGGDIHSFEAVPTIFQGLERNVAAFRRAFPQVRFHTHCEAVSERAGTVRMELPSGFEENQGLARVGENGSLEVKAVALDDVFGAKERIGIMKLDVEGHELPVLHGAAKLFGAHRVRDCVFEEHRPYPSAVTTWFESHGYRVFRILRPLTGPKLGNPTFEGPDVAWLPQNFLATCDETRTRRRFAARGWKSLSP